MATAVIAFIIIALTVGLSGAVGHAMAEKSTKLSWTNAKPICLETKYAN